MIKETPCFLSMFIFIFTDRYTARDYKTGSGYIRNMVGQV